MSTHLTSGCSCKWNINPLTKRTLTCNKSSVHCTTWRILARTQPVNVFNHNQHDLLWKKRKKKVISWTLWFKARAFGTTHCYSTDKTNSTLENFPYVHVIRLAYADAFMGMYRAYTSSLWSKVPSQTHKPRVIYSWGLCSDVDDRTDQSLLWKQSILT